MFSPHLQSRSLLHRSDEADVPERTCRGALHRESAVDVGRAGRPLGYGKAGSLEATPIRRDRRLGVVCSADELVICLAVVGVLPPLGDFAVPHVQDEDLIEVMGLTILLAGTYV